MSYRKGRRPLTYSDRSEVSSALSSHYSESAVSNVTPSTQFQRAPSNVSGSYHGPRHSRARIPFPKMSPMGSNPYEQDEFIESLPVMDLQKRMKNVEIRTAPKQPNLPQAMHSKMKRAKRKERMRREEAQREKAQIRYRSRHRDSDDSICSELQDKYDNVLRNEYERRDQKELYNLDSAHRRLGGNHKINEHEHKWIESGIRYKTYEEEMANKAGDELFERKSDLKSLNYKMKKAGFDLEEQERRGSRLKDKVRDNEIKRRGLMRNKRVHEFDGKVTNVKRLHAMIDAGIVDDEDLVEDLNYAAREHDAMQRMEKQEKQRMRKQKKKNKHGKEWMQSVLNY